MLLSSRCAPCGGGLCDVTPRLRPGSGWSDLILSQYRVPLRQGYFLRGKRGLFIELPCVPVVGPAVAAVDDVQAVICLDAVVGADVCAWGNQSPILVVHACLAALGTHPSPSFLNCISKFIPTIYSGKNILQVIVEKK